MVTLNRKVPHILDRQNMSKEEDGKKFNFNGQKGKVNLVFTLKLEDPLKTLLFFFGLSGAKIVN